MQDKYLAELTNEELITLVCNQVRVKNTEVRNTANKAFIFYSNTLVDRHFQKTDELSIRDILKLRGEQVKGDFEGTSKTP